MKGEGDRGAGGEIVRQLTVGGRISEPSFTVDPYNYDRTPAIMTPQNWTPAITTLPK